MFCQTAAQSVPWSYQSFASKLHIITSALSVCWEAPIAPPASSSKALNTLSMCKSTHTHIYIYTNKLASKHKYTSESANNSCRSLNIYTYIIVATSPSCFSSQILGVLNRFCRVCEKPLLCLMGLWLGSALSMSSPPHIQ